MTPETFLQRANRRFANNQYQYITEASFREFAADILATFLAQTTGPNNRPDLSKSVRYFRRADLLADTYGGDCFEDLIEHSPALLCALATVFKVEFYRLTDGDDYEMNVELVATYDPDSPIYVSRTGAFGGDIVPAKFVPRNSPEAKYGYLRRYALQPDGTPVVSDWRQGERCIYTLNGEDAFFFAKRPGLLAAPGATETADWRPAPAPTPGGGGAGEGTVKAVETILPDAAGNVTLPKLDTQGYSAAKRAQVFGFFTSSTQFKAVDVPLDGDTSTGVGSEIPDFANGDVYKLYADPDNPMPDPLDGNRTIGTPTWLRTSFS